MIKKIFNYIFAPVYKAIVKELNINYFTNDLVRIGKPNDGGYVVIKSSLNTYKQLISFGIAGDISFEKQFQSYNQCMISCFDPSVEGLPEPMENTKFHKLGIDSKNYGSYVDLKTTINLSRFESDEKIFMKMDIEGYEWNILNDSKSFDILKNFDQIVIELHMKYLLGRSKFWMPLELIKRLFILRKLKKYFNFFNINSNNVCGYIKFSDFIFPEVVEISMINKSCIKNVLIDINQPSDPLLPNIQEFLLK